MTSTHSPADSRIPRIGVIALAAFLLCLPFLGSLPFMDPDEAFYPATAAESMASGDALDLRLNGEPRWVKPPGQYALIQVSFAVFGKSEIAARLVPVIEGALLVLLLGLLVKRLAGDMAGRLAALVLASTLAHTFYSRAAHPEMALSLGTAVGTLLLACWLLEDRPPKWLLLAAGLALGFAFNAKGPVCLVPPLLMILLGLPLLKGAARPSWKRALGGFAVAAALSVAMAAPWFLWMGAKHGDVFWDTVFGQLGHLTSDEFKRDNSSVFYFVPVLLAGSLPWLGVLPQSLRRVKRGETANRERLRTLMAATLLGTFVFFSLSSAQRVNYGLHFFPPLAVIVGLWLEEVMEGEGAGSRALKNAVALLVLLAAGGALALYLLAGGLEQEAASMQTPEEFRQWLRLSGMFMGMIACLVVLVTFSGLLLAKRLGPVLPALAGALLLTILIGVGSEALQRTQSPLRRISESVLATESGQAASFAVYRKRLPSVSFYLSREALWPHSPEELEAYLARPGHPWLLIQTRHLPLIDGERFEVVDAAIPYSLLRRKTSEPGGMK